MIRIENIIIKEFRGIRDLTLEFKEKNFAICGPNGTGKSGIVDAIEFVLTGNVSRLSGEGRGDVSLKQHGPHVDKRDDPEKSSVSIEVSIPSLNQKVKIQRNLKNHTTAEISVNDPSVVSAMEKVKGQPEIVLSRRELIRYVLATPGDRAKEVQALLHLDQVEQVRVGLQKIANSCEKQLIPIVASVTQARTNLLRALCLTELQTESILTASNEQRIILGLSALTEITDKTSLKDGLATTAINRSQLIPKLQALADIKTIRDAITKIKEPAMVVIITEVIETLEHLIQDPYVATSLKRESLYSTGLELIDTGSCPLCDDPWNIDELKRKINTKIKGLHELSRKRKDAEVKLVPLIAIMHNLQTAIKNILGYTQLAKLQQATEVSEYSTNCAAAIDSLSSITDLAQTIKVLKTFTALHNGFNGTIEALGKIYSALPEPTKQDAALEWLTIAQERLEVWREAKRKHAISEMQAKRVRKIYDIYANTSDKMLTGIYKTVEKDFANLYALINHDDEDQFKAKLVPSMGKLGFDVDFYGRGFFPPGAYHSEGHQDSMGICLYLALMRHIHANEFTLAVLDDVLMSVDAGHRREVCTMLKKEFPNTQFIITTHDQIWLRHMRTEKIIEARSAIQFRAWSVDEGPSHWDDRDVWEEIDGNLKQNNVRAAASLLRHYLEYESAELCNRLHAPVGFRGDAHYQLGELLPYAMIRMHDLIRRAKESANSWNQKEIGTKLAEFEANFSQLVNTSKIEQWQVNIVVHYNSWENLSKEDFVPVVKAFQELLRGFACPTCNEYLYVSPDRETAEALRCGCNKINYNLRKKG